MTGIRLTRFGGLDFSRTDRHIGSDQATVAHNVQLRDGSLRPFCEPKELKCADYQIATVVETPSIEDACGKVLCFEECVSVTFPLDPDCSGMTTGVVWPETGGEPQRFFLDDCDTMYPLVVPPPTTAAMLTVAGASPLAQDDRVSPDSIAYTYTWVDQFGIESAPAPASNVEISNDDQTKSLVGFDTPPPNATCIRIYRTTTRFTDQSQVAPTFQLVEEVPLTNWFGTYTDNRLLKDIDGGDLCTMMKCPPPECLTDVHETDEGYHVGFLGNDIFFSERNEPDNWPDRYKLTLPYRVTNLVVNDTLVYVGTTGNPFLIRTGPRQDDLSEMTVLRADVSMYDQSYPAYGRRTMAMTAWGAAYVSREGIVALQPSLPARVLTRQRIDEDRWPSFIPNRLAWCNGRLYGSRSPHGCSWVMDVRGEPEGPKDYGDFTTLDMAATDIFCTPSGRVIYAEGNCVFEWDAGRNPMKYRWRSKRYVAPGRMRYTAGKIVGDFGTDVSFSLVTDSDFSTCDVDSSEPFRIKSRTKHTDWFLEICGTTRVHEMHVATSVRELAEQAIQTPNGAQQ